MKNKINHPFTLFLYLVLSFTLICCTSDDSQNTEIVKRYYNALIKGDSSIAKTILSDNFEKINNGKIEQPTGPKVLNKSIRNHKNRNSEYKYIIENIFADGDFVAVRWRWKSINIKTGSPKKMNIPGLAIFKINSDHKIEKQWQSFDMEMFKQQLFSDN